MKAFSQSAEIYSINTFPDSVIFLLMIHFNHLASSQTIQLSDSIGVFPSEDADLLYLINRKSITPVAVNYNNSCKST